MKPPKPRLERRPRTNREEQSHSSGVQEMVARINGEEWSRGNTSMMDHQFEGVLAHLSHNQSIHPGEIFGSGTVPTGCGLEHNRYLSDGDTIELDVEGIGVLQNRIVKPDDWRDRRSQDKN